MQVKITRQHTGPDVSEMILGHNIEMCLGTADGLLSERLRNPKFVGPPHRMTGIAPEWQGASMGQVAYELTPGAGLRGSDAQLVSTKEGSGGSPHLHQNKLQVRAGERLELEVWARAWHGPVTMHVALHPLASRAAAYDSGEIVVDRPWYARYTLPLQPTQDDDEARLSITLPKGGELWIDQIHLRPAGEPLLCRAVVEEMAHMRIPALRFPGGIVVNAYHWYHGTGPVHLRPAMLEAAFHQDWYLNYDFGLDEYLGLCREQGITPTLTLNVATGTPAEAAELAAYCAGWFQQAGGEVPLIYWHMANHPYHNTTAHMTPAMYADVLRTFVPAVKGAYPHSRIVAVMSWGAAASDEEQAVWKHTLFDEAADLIDVVMMQYYGGVDPTTGAEEQASHLASTLDTFDRGIRAFLEECRARNVPWNVGIAEWNWWMQASHWDGRDFEEPPTALHCLFIAGMIHRFAKLAPDFEIAHFYNLVNCMGILNHRGADIEVTDALETFKLYRPALPAKLISLEAAREDGEDAAYLDALCLQQGERSTLFLVNRGVAETLQAALTGFAFAGAECVQLSASSPLGALTRTTRVLTEARVDIPPLSIVRITQS